MESLLVIARPTVTTIPGIVYLQSQKWVITVGVPGTPSGIKLVGTLYCRALNTQ